MKHGELIKALRALVIATNSLRYNPDVDPDAAEAYERILVNLRDELCQEKAAPPNPPLTLEELREMDGEPVWIVEPLCRAQWALVHRKKQMKMGLDIYLIRSDGVQIKAVAFLRIGGLIYRRKPEAGTT